MLKDFILTQKPNIDRPRFSVKKAIQDEVDHYDLIRWCREAEPVFEIIPPLAEEPKHFSLASVIAFGKSLSL